jgi:hypothetical protein
MRFITRIDASHVRGFYVRVRAHGEEIAPRFFGIASHGSWRRAQIAAKTYRDRLMTDFGAPRRRLRRKVIDARSWSGEIGVRFQVYGSGNSDRHYAHWATTWQNGNGRTIGRSFSIHRYGYRTAWLYAVLARRRGLGLPVDTVPPPPPRRLVLSYLRRRLGSSWRRLLAYPIPWEK